MVSAASSLTLVMEAIAADYARTTGVAIDLNLSASSSLARQVVEGAPVDVFLSADVAQMDRVEEAGALVPGTRVDLLSNQLVVAVPDPGGATTLRSLEDLAGPGVRRIGIGDPEAVPVGVYARGHLESLGLWHTLSAKMVPLSNVRAVLAVVQSGDVDAGFVYRTDLRSAPGAALALSVPVDEGPRIVYPAAVVRRSRAPAASRRLLAYLGGPAAGAIFSRYGFIVRGLDGDR